MAEEVSFIETLLQSWVQFVPDLQATLTEAAGQIFFVLKSSTESTAVLLKGKSEEKKIKRLPCKFLCI